MGVKTPVKDEVHEAKCRRCGVSCHFAVPINGLPVVVDGIHCRFLEDTGQGTFRCGVYEERFEHAPWCHTVDSSLKNGLLAQDCLYASGVSGYRGKTRLSKRLEQRVLPHVRAELMAHGVPVGVSTEGVQRFMSRTGGGEWAFELSEDGSRFRLRPVDGSSSQPE